MVYYLKVSDQTDSEIKEIPTNEDGILALSSLARLYPGVIGLKYIVNERIRLVKICNEKLIAPDEGWNTYRYYCLYPRENNRSDDNASATISAPCIDLLVLGVSWKLTESELHAYFSQFGSLALAELKFDPVTKRSKGFGFIRFLEHEAQVRVLLQRHWIKGRWCNVVVSSTQNTVKINSKKIFIDHLTETISEDDLRFYFGQFGEIDGVSYVPLKGYAFICFKEEESVQIVLRQQHFINNEMITVTEFASRKRNRSNRPANLIEVQKKKRRRKRRGRPNGTNEQNNLQFVQRSQ